MLAFFLGILACALVQQGGALLLERHESKRRQLVARIRGTKVPLMPVVRGELVRGWQRSASLLPASAWAPRSSAHWLSDDSPF